MHAKKLRGHSEVTLRLALGALTLSSASGDVTRAQDTDRGGPSATRIVHRFDFDERPAGNLEDLPKYWEPLRPRRFPHYAHGSFDFEVETAERLVAAERPGRPAPPSFHLNSEGRNVAFQYTGPETRVRANADYRIVGYIRPDRLEHGRACLSAHFLDPAGRPMPGTLVRSEYVGGPEATNDWVRVDLHLRASREAHTIGLIVWVLQESIWNTSPPASRHIPERDIEGGAWFDNITIYDIPRVDLATTTPGNLVAPGEPQALLVTLADEDDPPVVGQLSIFAADGELVETRSIDAMTDGTTEPLRIPIEHLAPGLYEARLEAFAGSDRLVSKTLTFARLAPRTRSKKSASHGFGLVVDPELRSRPETELALLSQQVVRSVKLPVWGGRAVEPPTIPERRGTDRMLQSLVKRGFALTGMFAGPPSAMVRNDGAYVRPLIDLLAGDPDTWKEHLAAVVTPYANVFKWWQIGLDPGAGSRRPAGRREQAIRHLRDALRPFLSVPRLSVPVATGLNTGGRMPPEAKAKLPVEEVTATLGPEIPKTWFRPQIDQLKSLGYQKVSAYVPSLPADRYARIPRIADWAQRVITARHAGADTVFVPQTWHVRETPRGRVTEPTEAYLLLRTIADVLGDAAPGPRVRVAEGVECLAFDDGESTILALWDSQAVRTARRYPLQVGQADHQIDLWGVAHPLPRDDDGRRIIELTAVPVFVPGVAKWLIDFRTSMTLKPAHVESGRELVRHTIDMTYTGNRTVSGNVEPVGPESWSILPRQYSFNLSPQSGGSHLVEIHYPHNEPAGLKVLRAKITLNPGLYHLEVPLTIDVSLSDVNVSGLAVVQGTRLVLRHMVTNRSSQVLSFRGSARVPGRERQYRPISNLRPGETQTVEYHFNRASKLIGRQARLVLREMNGGPRIHDLELTIP